MSELPVAPGVMPRGLLVIAGPTAVGKTDMAAELARRLGAEIVSADSRQVYRYMDVGTAKPSNSLRKEIVHHMIDVVDPGDEYDVSSWCEGARAGIVRTHEGGRTPILCGGTGMYIQSLLEGLAPIPPGDEELRGRLRRDEENSPGTLHRRLVERDPASASRIHANDKLRLVRALEVLELSGVPLSRLHDEARDESGGFESLIMELVLERDELYRRIDARSEAIVRGGLLEELSALRERGYPHDAKAFSAIGYREAGQCLDGHLARADLAQAIARATRQYAKRQLTWLRGRARTHKVECGDVDTALRLAERFLNSVANG